MEMLLVVIKAKQGAYGGIVSGNRIQCSTNGGVLV